ncbi:hypothetical protein Glove_1g44 [Diversispora epigaea]|uniref:Uncharacterized protein n=1 Tax=Diversispora epigaea TaxID=1348612 RepID=A0A397JPK7_9GLOM|nr:hypothetical protein Glove_1g44 [Diversispora epigaea]
MLIGTLKQTIKMRCYAPVSKTEPEEESIPSGLTSLGTAGHKDQNLMNLSKIVMQPFRRQNQGKSVSPQDLRA